MKYVCDVCDWVYDEEAGYPEGGIAPGTKWEDVPDDFECPLCGVGKDSFSEQSRLSDYRQTYGCGGGGRWGSTPNPGRGPCPLHPVIGASPQGIMCLVGYPCFGLAFPFGATPQAPRERLVPGQVKNVQRKGGSLSGAASACRKKPVGIRGASPFPEAQFPSILRLHAKSLAWGFGAEPQMATQGQSRDNKSNSESPWGEAPKTGCRGMIPLPGRGAEPHILLPQRDGGTVEHRCRLSFFVFYADRFFTALTVQVAPQRFRTSHSAKPAACSAWISCSTVSGVS